jgi:hypothetical protein
MKKRELQDFAWIFEHIIPKWLFEDDREYYEENEIKLAMLCEYEHEKIQNFIKFANCPK